VKRTHQRIQEKAFDMSQDVCIRSLNQKQETRGRESLTNPGVPREQSVAEQERGQRTHAAQKTAEAPLSPQLPTPPAHPATAEQSDAVLYNLPIETVSQGMPPGREGSRCLTRQEQVASYSLVLVVTAATATTLRAAVFLSRKP